MSGGFQEMGQISIRLTDEMERNLKRLAKENGKNLAEFCREKLISEAIEDQPLSRVSIENEIDELKHTIEMMNKNMITATKIITENSILNSELSLEFIDLALGKNTDKIEKTKEKLRIYNDAKARAKEKVKKYFK